MLIEAVLSKGLCAGVRSVKILLRILSILFLRWKAAGA
jgi:hypothetical protein